MLGKSLTHAEGRIFVFKVERILGARVLERSFTVPRDFDVRNYAGDHLFIGGLRPVPVKLRLRGAAAKRLSGWYKNAKQERDGAVVVQSQETLSGWFAAWVLRQGPEVEVVSPPELASWVRTLASRIAERHRPAPPAGGACPIWCSGLSDDYDESASDKYPGLVRRRCDGRSLNSAGREPSLPVVMARRCDRFTVA